MADTIGPFDGSPWAEAQWYRHAGMWAPSGVLGSPVGSTSAGELPLSTSGRSAGLGAGRAWVRGGGFERTGAAVLQAVSANTHASFNRRDRLVLRRDLATHTITPTLLTGTAAASPAAPALSRVEAGAWDLPMYSFLVPPNSGTSLSGIVDERASISAGGVLMVPSIAIRDAHFPSPTGGEQCLVGGTLHVHDGTAWRFDLTGTFSGSTDSQGLLSFSHGAGQAPTSWGVTPGAQGTDTLNKILKLIAANNTSSTLTVRAVRTDTSDYLAVNPINGNWWARF